MTNRNIELTRRKILGAAGAVGVAGAGAGLGTTALFSDEESFTNSSIIAAATLDLKITAEIVEASEYYTSSGDGPDVIGETKIADGDPVVGLQTSDVKPGDWVIVCFEIDSTDPDDPGYVRVSADGFAQYENGQSEPEIAAEGDDGTGAGSLGTSLNGDGEGELQDELLAEVYGTYDSSLGSDPPRSYLGSKEPSLSGSARATFEQFATGYVIGGPADPLVIGSDDNTIERYLLLELPTDVGNEVQSDAIEFDLVFDAVQTDNNDGFDPSSSLVGYWPLNDVENAPVEDISGNGNDGTVQGDVSAVSGQVAGAGSFDGINDYIDLGSQLSQSFSSMTVAAWMRNGSSGGYQAIVERNYWNADDGFGLFVNDQNVSWGHYSGGPTVTSGASVRDGSWHHVVGTLQPDSSSNKHTYKIYVDSNQEGSATIDRSVASSSVKTGIGRRIASFAGNYYFDGSIDDVRIYDRALSDTEVADLYDETK